MLPASMFASVGVHPSPAQAHYASTMIVGRYGGQLPAVWARAGARSRVLHNCIERIVVKLPSVPLIVGDTVVRANRLAKVDTSPPFDWI